MGTYTREQWTDQAIKLFPPGIAFNSDPNSNFYKLIYALMGEFKAFNDFSNAIIEDWNPLTTTNFLEEWQSSLGLPDQCVTYQSSFEDQRNQVISRINFTGQSNINFLSGLCTSLGYEVDIKEWGQMICNVQACGAYACGPADRSNETYITINITNSKDASLLICELKPFIPPYLNFLIFENGTLAYEN